MKLPDNKLVHTIKHLLGLYKQEEIDVYAAYATLYILMALMPLLMLVIAVVNMMPWFSANDLTEMLFSVLPDLSQVKSMFLGIVSNLNVQSSGLLASVAALTSLWSASSGVSAIQRGLQKVTIGAEAGRFDKPKAVLFTFLFIIMVLALLVFGVLGDSIRTLLVSIGESFGIEELMSRVSSIMHVSNIFVLLFAVLVITLMFCYLPGGRRTMKSQLPGAILTIVAWVVFTVVFSFFISRFWSASAIYGSLAAIFLMTMWLRYMLTILFVGAGYNQIDAVAKLGQDGEEPSEHDLRIASAMTDEAPADAEASK